MFRDFFHFIRISLFVFILFEALVVKAQGGGGGAAKIQQFIFA